MANKRGNGQGTARKRGSTWTAVWTEGFISTSDKNLKQICRTKGGFRTKTQALAFAADPHPERAGDCPNLQYYWDLWSTHGMLSLSKSKQTAYRSAYRKIESIIFIPVDALTVKDLQDVVDVKAPTHYTARDIKSLLSYLYKLAMAEQRVQINLAEILTIPELCEGEMQPFTEIELRKIWDAYGSGDSFAGFLLLMIYTGMMPGELFNFKADMIDWTKHEIIGCGLKTKMRKETPIVFPDLLVPVLADMCTQTKSRIGKVLCMNRDKFYVEYHAALNRIGVRDLPPYSCRHTTATALALGNIAPSVIQSVMRHAKFATTQRYIHPDMQAEIAAVNSMGKGKAEGE